VAHALGRGDAVVVMDDNVAPEAYWPCFQAFAARLGPQPARRRSATAPGTSAPNRSA